MAEGAVFSIQTSTGPVNITLGENVKLVAEEVGGDLSITAGFAIRDIQEGLPYALLERRPFQVQPEIKVTPTTGEIFAELI